MLFRRKRGMKKGAMRLVKQEVGILERIGCAPFLQGFEFPALFSLSNSGNRGKIQNSAKVVHLQFI